MSTRYLANKVGDRFLDGSIKNLSDLENLIETLKDFRLAAKEGSINYKGWTVYGSYIPSGEVDITLLFTPEDKEAFDKINSK